MRLGMVYKIGWRMDDEDIRSICIQSYSDNYGYYKVFRNKTERVLELYPNNDWYREKPLACMRVQ